MNNDMIDDNHSPVVDDIEDEMEQVMEEEIAINALSMTQNENKRIELAKLHILQNVVICRPYRYGVVLKYCFPFTTVYMRSL